MLISIAIIYKQRQESKDKSRQDRDSTTMASSLLCSIWASRSPLARSLAHHCVNERATNELFVRCGRRGLSQVSHSKVVGSAQEALEGMDLANATVAVGGFGLGGIPETLITALSQHESAHHLTLISLTAGTDTQGAGKLLAVTGKVHKLIAAYVGENKVLEQAYFGGSLQVELTPMGTIAERLRAGGAGTCQANHVFLYHVCASCNCGRSAMLLSLYCAPVFLCSSSSHVCCFFGGVLVWDLAFTTLMVCLVAFSLSLYLPIYTPSLSMRQYYRHTSLFYSNRCGDNLCQRWYSSPIQGGWQSRRALVLCRKTKSCL